MYVCVLDVRAQNVPMYRFFLKQKGAFHIPLSPSQYVQRFDLEMLRHCSFKKVRALNVPMYRFFLKLPMQILPKSQKRHLARFPK